MINPAPIGSLSSLNVGGSRRTQDLDLKLVNSFTIQSRVKRKQLSTSVFTEEFPRKNQIV